MTTKQPQPIRQTALGQALIPVALLALVGLVGGLTWHARRMESSHRATAEGALRDYAAIAAWQFTRDATGAVHSTAHTTLNKVTPLLQARTDRPLPHPESLVAWGDTVACGIGRAARSAFRVDLPSGEMTTGGRAMDEPLRRALRERVASLPTLRGPREDRIYMIVDTIAGEARAIAAGVVRGLDDEPRAIYGVEAPASSLTEVLAGVRRTTSLLPPSLVGDRPVDSLLALRVLAPDGTVLLARGEPRGDLLAATDTLATADGGLRVVVSLHPESATALLIGGMPGSRVRMLDLVLVASLLLAAIALQQLRRGRELARLRNRFVASVSHELRTPLAQISMFSETLLLARERSPEERQQFLGVIFREARRLTNLVESVLRFSRAEAGGRPLRPEPRDVGEEVRDAVRAFSPLAAAAGVELRTELEEGTLAMVEPDALRQIVINLLDNAVKFGPEGQHVTARVAREGGDVVVMVDDEGPGIPESERTRIFQPFAQGESARSRTSTGAGIGLAVVAELVRAHGGRVRVEDAPGGRGTRALFTVPALAEEPVEPRPERIEPPEAREPIAAGAPAPAWASAAAPR